MKKTSPQLEQLVLGKIQLGYPYADIAESTGVAVSTIKKIKARNKDRYEADKSELANWSLDHAKAVMSHAYELLNRRLDESGDKLSINELLRILKYADRMTISERDSHSRKSFAGQQKRPR